MRRDLFLQIKDKNNSRAFTMTGLFRYTLKSLLELWGPQRL
jgi:hypothetical protein